MAGPVRLLMMLDIVAVVVVVFVIIVVVVVLVLEGKAQPDSLMSTRIETVYQSLPCDHTWSTAERQAQAHQLKSNLGACL